MTGAPPRDAATVVLLRDGPVGVETYLLRRVVAMPFAGGMTAFPGGSVDGRDADTSVRWAGPPVPEWARILRCDPPTARALVCAAVRETFEEAGVLLAGPDQRAITVRYPGWEADRAAVESRAVSLAELLTRRGLVLRSDLLAGWARWITPVREPRRYDTRFFLARVPDGQDAPLAVDAITREADAVEWVRPADAVAQAESGERPMLPPTVTTLRELAGYPTVTAALAAAADRVLAPIIPELDARNDRVHLPDGTTLPLPPGFRPVG